MIKIWWIRNGWNFAWIHLESYVENLTNCPCGEKCFDGCPCPSISTYDCNVPITSVPSTFTTATPPQNVDIVPGDLVINYPELDADCFYNRWDRPTPENPLRDPLRGTTRPDYVTHYEHRGVSQFNSHHSSWFWQRSPLWLPLKLNSASFGAGNENRKGNFQISYTGNGLEIDFFIHLSDICMT